MVTGSHQADTSAAKVEADQNVQNIDVTPDTSLKKQVEGKGSDLYHAVTCPPLTHHVLMSELKDDAVKNVPSMFCTFDTSLKRGERERCVLTAGLASPTESSKHASSVTTTRCQLRRPKHREKFVPTK